MELLLWIGTASTILLIIAIIGTIAAAVHKRSKAAAKARWYKTWDDHIEHRNGKA